MLKKLLLAITFPLVALAQGEPSANHLWERAAYGDKPGLTKVELAGFNGGITTTYEPLWGESAAYTLLTAALSTPYCASTSANDDVGSTGAEAMIVTGVKTDYSAFTETVALDGQTSVNLATTNVYFINSMRITGAGSNFVNAGVVACGTGVNTAGDPAVIHSYMAAGFGRAYTAMYVVPDNYTLICRNWTLSSYDVTAAESVQFVVDSYFDPIADKVLNRRVLGHVNQAGASTVVVPDTIAFGEKTAVIVQALSAASTDGAAVRAECLLVSDTWENTAQSVF